MIIVPTETYQQQINTELKSMDNRLGDLEEKMSSIDGKLTQVVDAILGNPLTKDGGFIQEIKELKKEVAILKTKAEKQEEFRQRVYWTMGVFITLALVIQYVTRIYSDIK